MYTLDHHRHLVAFYYDYPELLKLVWQRTSYMARATKSADVQNDLREKALSPDDEELFKDYIVASASNAYTPLIKWGKHIRAAISVDNSNTCYERKYNFGQNYTITSAYDSTGVNFTLTPVDMTNVDHVDTDITIEASYFYFVKTVTNESEQRCSKVVTTIRKTDKQATTKHVNVTLDIDTTDNGLGAESLICKDTIVIDSVTYKKVEPIEYQPGDWIEYYDEDGRVFHLQATCPCNENDDMPFSPICFEPQLECFYNRIAYEVSIDHFDANMCIPIDSALREALVADVIERWCCLAVPAQLESAALTNQRAQENLDKAVFNSTPHLHRVNQHWY